MVVLIGFLVCLSGIGLFCNLAAIGNGIDKHFDYNILSGLLIVLYFFIPFLMFSAKLSKGRLIPDLCIMNKHKLTKFYWPDKEYKAGIKSVCGRCGGIEYTGEYLEWEEYKKEQAKKDKQRPKLAKYKANAQAIAQDHVDLYEAMVELEGEIIQIKSSFIQKVEPRKLSFSVGDILKER